MKESVSKELLKLDPKKVYEMRIRNEIYRFPYMFWTDKENIRKVLIYLLEEKLELTKEEIADVMCVDFIKENKLYGIMQYFNGSPYAILDFLYPNYYKKWELKNAPLNTWDDKTTKEAIRWLIEKKKRWNKQQVCKNFNKQLLRDTGLRGLLLFVNDNVYEALNLAYPGMYKRWELHMGSWDDNSRCEAIKWLFEEKLEWKKEEILAHTSKKIFIDNGLSSILRYYNGNVVKIINLAYPDILFEKD